MFYFFASGGNGNSARQAPFFLYEFFRFGDITIVHNRTALKSALKERL
jgi:hypothetical protein